MPSPLPPTPANPGDAPALALLDQIADDLLRLFPETATSLGIDTGSRAGLRSQLADRSADGVTRLANQVRTALERVKTLLLETDLPLAAIAKRTGFNYIEYLNEAFKKWVGTTPGKYRKEASSNRPRDHQRLRRTSRK